MRTQWLVLALIATLGLSLPDAGAATDIVVDDPTFVLRTVDPTSIEFGSADLPAIPADFFYPGSDPFTGLVVMQGEPVRPNDDADLVIRGVGPVVLPPAPSSDEIPIELVELKLVSSGPIIVTGTQPDIDIDIEINPGPTPSTGTLKFDRFDDLLGSVTYAYDGFDRRILTTDPFDVVREIPYTPPATTPIPFDWTITKSPTTPNDADFVIPDGVTGELQSDVPGYNHRFEQAKGQPPIPSLATPALVVLAVLALALGAFVLRRTPSATG